MALRRKRTASERAINNADPLLARKKAREAMKSDTAPPAVSFAHFCTWKDLHMIFE